LSTMGTELHCASFANEIIFLVPLKILAHANIAHKYLRLPQKISKTFLYDREKWRRGYQGGGVNSISTIF
jgi:hypothetical protein